MGRYQEYVTLEDAWHKEVGTVVRMNYTVISNRRYFEYAHFIPIVGVEKRGVY